jgi:hypothetical protein
VIVESQAPVVAIARPASGLALTQGAAVTVAVTAGEPGGGPLTADPTNPALPLDTSHVGTFMVQRTAADLCGHSTTASIAYVVTSRAPALGALKLTPKTYRRAGRHSQPTVVVSYTDSEAATTTLVVTRPATGVKSGTACVAPSRHRHGKRCTRTLEFASFVHRDTVGANVFSLLGGGGAKLGHVAAGSYRLTLVAKNAGGRTSPPASTTFKVRR